MSSNGMDERDKNPLTISDILEQLVKPSVVQSGTQPLQPKPVAPPLPTSIPSKQELGSVSLPQLGKQGLQGPILKSTNEVAGKPSDRRPTIRTMGDDLAKLKQGLAPIGSVLEIKKDTLGALTKQPPPAVPKKAENIPQETLNKPILPSIPNRSTTLPERPLPPKIQPPFSSQKPVLPPVAQSPFLPGRPAHIHEETRILDKDNLPAFLGAPIPKKIAPKPEEEKIEYGVIAKIIGSGMTTGIVSTMILAVIAYGLIYYFFLREEAVITTTPLPTPIQTSPTAETNELEEIFRTTPVTTFSLPADSSRSTSEFKSFLEKEVLTQKEFKKVKFLPFQQGEALTFSTLLNKLAIKYPIELNDWIRNSNIVLLYGQMEKFNDSDEPGKRLVFIVEVKDISRVTEIMKNWEITMAGNLKDLFDIDPSKESSTVFLDNEYQTVRIRYKNFPLPDRTIDYAVVSSLTGRHYLILTNSRESIYSPINKIKGI